MSAAAEAPVADGAAAEAPEAEAVAPEAEAPEVAAPAELAGAPLAAAAATPVVRPAVSEMGLKGAGKIRTAAGLKTLNPVAGLEIVAFVAVGSDDACANASEAKNEGPAKATMPKIKTLFAIFLMKLPSSIT
jgi:pyruvate/2-oxoglutarate dehydrogenase complex dihydrolipoamide acyltransferase (E2) component